MTKVEVVPAGGETRGCKGPFLLELPGMRQGLPQVDSRTPMTAKSAYSGRDSDFDGDMAYGTACDSPQWPHIAPIDRLRTPAEVLHEPGK